MNFAAKCDKYHLNIWGAVWLWGLHNVSLHWTLLDRLDTFLLRQDSGPGPDSGSGDQCSAGLRWGRSQVSQYITWPTDTNTVNTSRVVWWWQFNSKLFKYYLLLLWSFVLFDEEFGEFLCVILSKWLLNWKWNVFRRLILVVMLGFINHIDWANSIPLWNLRMVKRRIL